MPSPSSYSQQLILQLSGQRVALKITASQRKSMRLGVNQQGEVEVRIPFQVAQKQVLAFVQQHENWILERRQALLKPQVLTELWLDGKARQIVRKANQGLLLQETELWVPEFFSETDLKQAIDNLLHWRAKQAFPMLIERWWPKFCQYRATAPSLRIKKMRTRWGSLSMKGYINMNCLLMHMPSEVQELVVVHELCHLRHQNHGAGFKALLGQHLPDWQEREKVLALFSKRVIY